MDERELEKLGYKLVWSDEFDGPELNRDVWNVEEHAANWINEELQEFVDDGRHAFVKDGNLIIKPERIFAADKTATYKSARVTTEGNRDFTYGYFEVKAKISGGKGFLSAIRLLPTGSVYGEWPKSGSVDIMSADGQYPERGSSIMHFGEPSEERSGIIGDGYTDLSRDYHIYACEWLPGKMTFFMDGEEVFTNSFWFSSEGEGQEKKYPAPFDKPFNIELDVSIGGNWVSAPDRATSFEEEAEFKIDYIRCYQKDEYDTNVTMPSIQKNFREPDQTGNFIVNSSREWRFYKVCGGEASCDTDGTEFSIDIINVGDKEHSIQLYQPNLPLRKGTSYKLSFEAMAFENRDMKVAVTAPDIHWKRYLNDTKIELSETWQTHVLPFVMESDDDDNGRVEFNLGNCASSATVKIKNVRFEEQSHSTDTRKGIAICGAWEDAENYNLFTQTFLNPRVEKDYIVLAFTFGLTENSYADPVIGREFTDFIERFELAAIFVFAEMIKTQEILDRLRDIGKKKNIPVVFLERQSDGVINAVLNFADGFEKMVRHVLDVHKCRKVKFFAGSPDNPFSIERENIFRRLMLAHRLRVDKDDILYGLFWDAAAARELNDKLDEGMELPEAFICANDSMAVGVCDALRSRGIRVPDDVVVTGFDGVWHGRWHSPVISTAAPDYSSLCEYILDIIEGKESWVNGKTVRRPVNYIEAPGTSCGCDDSNPHKYEDIVNTLADYNQDYFRHMLEMGRFVTRTLSMNDIDQASHFLDTYLWLWKDQYYFVGLTKGFDENCVHSLINGRDSNFSFREKYYNMKYPLPNIDKIVARGSGINILLFKQLQTLNDQYGYVCSGYDSLSIRRQQRFEEFGLYVSAMVSSVFDKTKLVEANRAISRLNERDYLTNLYNRRGFFAHIDEMLKDPMNRGRIFSLFSIDMDGLKYINDHFGHQEGDNAIIILSKALLAYAGDRGICARYGGDEFAMAIVGDYNIAEDYMEIRARIHGHAMRDPIVRELDYSINASMGIAECVISGDVDLEGLIKQADLRMYDDKQARKGSNEIR